MYVEDEVNSTMNAVSIVLEDVEDVIAMDMALSYFIDKVTPKYLSDRVYLNKLKVAMSYDEDIVMAEHLKDILDGLRDSLYESRESHTAEFYK